MTRRVDVERLWCCLGVEGRGGFARNLARVTLRSGPSTMPRLSGVPGAERNSLCRRCEGVTGQNGADFATFFWRVAVEHSL